ncbi:glycine cleavage system aminomethyltransferase GcvT [Ectothiorhodospiraceae bacterium BW-2]|nr:glycine cleavage system aminomethyltransferase GcvT [Ectothiorhodospiraceae bacterium BW-2]
MSQQTPLYAIHCQQQATMVEFGSWQMPLHYGSQLDEHHAVRHRAGLFDVSHMGIVDLKGPRCREMLRYLLANDVAKLDGNHGKALYSCMLNRQGGVIDDLIVTLIEPSWYRLVINAATSTKDLHWIREIAVDFEVEVLERVELAMVAVQGPAARQLVHGVDAELAQLGEGLKRFQLALGERYALSRTGYTGEEGYEIVIDQAQAQTLWQQLCEAGATPCGLGARDTLRLEAGMNLYGQDMDETTSPWISGLGWTVDLKDPSRRFFGREALEQEQAAGIEWRWVGLLLQGRGVLRSHQRVRTAAGEGEITSGSFSPTLKQGIAMARVPLGEESEGEVIIRQRPYRATIVKLPFVREGRVLV